MFLQISMDLYYLHAVIFHNLHLLPLSPLLQPHRPPCCSHDIPGTLSLKFLWTFVIPYASLFPQSCRAYSLIFFREDFPDYMYHCNPSIYTWHSPTFLPDLFVFLWHLVPSDLLYILLICLLSLPIGLSQGRGFF